MTKNIDPEKIVREIKRKTRRKFSAEEKIRIVLDGLRGEETIAELCRREGISPNLYYNWSKEFLEAGKQRLIRRHIAFLYAVRERLRQETTREYAVYLSDADASRVSGSSNVGNALLEQIGEKDLPAPLEPEDGRYLM